jgi:rod shape-determining protein MreD
MLKSFVIPILIFIPLAVFQLVFVPLITVRNIGPNFVIVLLVYFTLRNGQFYGILLGFVLGFLLDLVSGGILGAYMFSFTIAGFIAGYFYNENKFDINTSSFVLSLITLLCAIISLFVYSTVTNNNNDVRMIYQIIEDGVLPGVYTALFSIPIAIFNPQKGIA